ncbi:E3 ubiquitin-protein ligase RFWD2 [Lingula anatina]|uniref:E3 ubiquitin-protein ligase RFWD2 n=1 Tax=Lingula anatina TaxID=7574 RepID=A0A1S3JBR8_LINAN|nr:E3 ubiquitin-protein ligase RFWD2 [Lingula anatina]|eukprot:XP_013407329.1 E3 ubiquitin-protein ligase RFWD2 [Lingula anatina]
MSGPRTQQSNRRRKRPQPPVHNGLFGSYEDKDNDFVCPICFGMIDEAHMTKCGHSFCHRCIKQSLDQSNRCPKCNFVMDTPDQIFPNFLLNELILKHRQKIEKKPKLEQQNGHITPVAVQDLLLDQDSLDLANVNFMLELLTQKKQRLESDSKIAQNQILKDFLQQLRQRKQEQLDRLTREVHIIDEDYSRVETALKEYKKKYPFTPLSPESSTLVNGLDQPLSAEPHCSSTSSSSGVSVGSSSQEGFNGSRHDGGKQWLQTTMASRRKKVSQHFDDLQQCYFSTRLKEYGSGETCSTSSDGLEDFSDSLSKFTQFSSFRPLATLSYASDIYNGSSIVSSIEFDRDCDYFAIAGVTKKIKVFEYNMVISDAVDMHYPVTEMVCNSKISCVTWSAYHKGTMASSDYEGTITIWDAFSGVKHRMFQEHEKRCWSVDFNRMDPKLIASGSDDAKVKLWSTDVEHSVASIEAKANVCCVKFNPESRYHLAFGSADHCVHYYDLRNTKVPLMTFKGHRKAVSYVKFVNSSDLVSASTDSQLKLWNVNKPQCVRTFRGHVNEKNFVGLATDGDYIACGSENNSLCVYFRGLSKQLVTYKFDTVRSVLEKDRKEEDTNEFVSAVSWRPGSNVVVAANSQGTIKILELV